MCLLIVLAFFALFGFGSFTQSMTTLTEIAAVEPVSVAPPSNLVYDLPLISTPSGLQYQVITEGTGARPTAADTVTVHFTGTLLDGTVFYSSYERGEPATFPLSGVISAWTEGVQLMSIGSTYRFIMPPDFAYGAQGVPPFVPSNATLIFVIELLGIEE